MLNYFNRNKLPLFAGLVSAAVVFGALLIAVPRTFAETEIAETSEEEDFSEEIPEGSLKFVTVFDTNSNEKITIKTDASTVAEVLDRLKISLDSADSTDPSLDSTINANNFFINIYRSRPVIILDGNLSRIVSTSSYDKKSIFAAAGLTVYDGDEVEISPNPNFLETGISTVYKLIRNGGHKITLEEEIPFSEKEEKDYNLETGKTEVRQLGEVGKKEKIYEVFYVNGEEVERKLVEEKIVREPVMRIVAVGAPKISATPLTAGMGRNRYTSTNLSGATVERQETYYDLPMSGVMGFCGKSSYSVREDGVKVDDDGFIIIAANLSRYPRCSVVETSLGAGKVYDTGGFATGNPEQFDIATDWTNHDGR